MSHCILCCVGCSLHGYLVCQRCPACYSICNFWFCKYCCLFGFDPRLLSLCSHDSPNVRVKVSFRFLGLL